LIVIIHNLSSTVVDALAPLPSPSSSSRHAMSFATPRGRVGGYPDTPAAGFRKRAPAASPTRSQNSRSSLPPAPENATAPTGAPDSQPLIPLTIIDAPSQRFYAFAIYVALFGWRLYDYLQVQDNGAHASYFFKWAAIDAIYLFSLPHLRIPWLELSSEFVLFAFFFAVVGDWWLMYNIPLPMQGWLLAMLKVFYDKELAISEHNVKVSSIIHNSSLIMGKQIINILPEGYEIP
jgi:nucleoporin POM152